MHSYFETLGNSTNMLTAQQKKGHKEKSIGPTLPSSVVLVCDKTSTISS